MSKAQGLESVPEIRGGSLVGDVQSVDETLQLEIDSFKDANASVPTASAWCAPCTACF